MENKPEARMTNLQVVPDAPISEPELIKRAIPKLASGGSGHLGTTLPDLTEIFTQQFGKPPTDTLNEMIKAGTVTVALIKWISYGDSYRHRSVPESIEILEEIPAEIPEGKRLRIYLSDNVSRYLKSAQKKRNKLREILEDIKK